MPELPEVETIKNQLKKEIIGKTVKKVVVELPKMLRNITVNEFVRKIAGTKIKNVARRAKLLIINLSNGYSLLIHLKMTGQIIYSQGKIQPPKYSHFIYYFSDGSCLFHADLRQLGYAKLIKTQNLKDFFRQEKYGFEPLKRDFTLKKFKEILLKRKRQKIKPLLMDQSFIAGIGNVYANEACFCANVLPNRKVADLSKEEIKKIYQCLLKILRQAIKYKGTSADEYLDIYGQAGKYLPRLKVYGREGEKCFRCQGRIKKIKLAGRGTYYCPVCQK